MGKTEKNGHLQPDSTKIQVMIYVNMYKLILVFILSIVWQIDTTKNDHSSTARGKLF